MVFIEMLAALLLLLLLLLLIIIMIIIITYNLILRIFHKLKWPNAYYKARLILKLKVTKKNIIKIVR